MEEALAQRLLAEASLTALIGQRITWGIREQSAALPAVVLNKVDSAPEYTAEGAIGLTSSLVQVDCWGETYASAKACSRAVMTALSGFAGDVGEVEFQGIYNDTEQDSFERATGEQDLHRVRLDFTVWHS